MAVIIGAATRGLLDVFGSKGGSGDIPTDVNSKLNSLIDDIRVNTGKDFPVGNAGAAITDIDGVTEEIISYSKYNNSISSSNLNHDYSYNFGKENRIFDTTAVNSDNVIGGLMHLIERWIPNRKYLKILHINWDIINLQLIIQ